MSSVKYHTVEVRTAEQEALLLDAGTPSRNYGRLNRETVEEIVLLPLQTTGKGLEKSKQGMLQRKRYWHCSRFVNELASNPSAIYGEVTLRNYKIRVLDGGVDEALGKGGGSELSDLVRLDPNEPKFRGPRNSKARLDLDTIKPYDLQKGLVHWENFQLWREIMSTSLVNLLPDRCFAIYIYAKNLVGDDVPVYYFEVEIDGESERHYCVWELDQVLSSARDGRPHEGTRTAEFASAYQKLYFYINWSKNEPRRIEKAVASDLPKSKHRKWDAYLEELGECRWNDAFISILLLIATTILSIQLKQYSISLVAGIVVSSIAAEEYIPPQAVLMGAIARFYANESLALHMYFQANNSLSAKRVLITLLASMGELVDYLNSPDVNGILDGFLHGKNHTGDEIVCNEITNWFGLGLCLGDIFLIFCTIVNCSGLVQSAFAGVIGGFSHSYYPWKMWYTPKCYVEKSEGSGIIRQTVMDCLPVEEFCSVFRPLLHWQTHADRRFLGHNIDWGSPGAPPSWMCYFLSTPACSVIVTKQAYGEWFRWNLVPLAIVEQLLGVVGGIMMLSLDFAVVGAIFVNLLLHKLHLVNANGVRHLNSVALDLYAPCGLLNIIYDSFYAFTAKALDLDTIYCRTRSTARLYRLPLARRVRTGRSSNHCWKFGDYLFDSAYYRCSDMVMVNPRFPKQGMMEGHRLMYKRHKLIWNTIKGKRYTNPVLSCGDNTTSRRNRYIKKAQLQSEKLIDNEKDGNNEEEDEKDKVKEDDGDDEVVIQIDGRDVTI